MDVGAREPIEVTVEIPSGSRNESQYDHLRQRYMLDCVPMDLEGVSRHRLRTLVSGRLGLDDVCRIFDEAHKASRESASQADLSTRR